MITTSNEQQNLDEIAGLSQRGTTLSIMDLVAANTLNAEMAAYGLYMMSLGGSVLTAAMPGNAGKTTLLACWLTGLPQDTKITTVTSPEMLGSFNGSPPSGETMLVHEFGSGPVYGYLWGKDVHRAFDLIQDQRSLASCIHADTLPQLEGILTSPELGVSKRDIAKIDLLCFLQLDQIDGQYRRRVARMYEAVGSADEHRELFRWNPETDDFTKNGTDSLHARLAERTGKSLSEVTDTLGSCQQFILDLQREGIRDFREVRRRLVTWKC